MTVTDIKTDEDMQITNIEAARSERSPRFLGSSTFLPCTSLSAVLYVSVIASRPVSGNASLEGKFAVRRDSHSFHWMFQEDGILNMQDDWSTI